MLDALDELTNHAKPLGGTETNHTRKTMQPLTLNQAAKVAHKSKAAILEAIRSGRLSAKRNELGQWEIDPAELFRVYPQNQSGTGDENRDLPPEENHPTPVLLEKIASFEERLRAIEAERERERRQLEGQITDLKADRDHWRQQATALLTHQQQPPAETRPGFWRRLFGSP